MHYLRPGRDRIPQISGRKFVPDCRSSWNKTVSGLPVTLPFPVSIVVSLYQSPAYIFELAVVKTLDVPLECRCYRYQYLEVGLSHYDFC